jgi:hypothetical protein
MRTPAACIALITASCACTARFAAAESPVLRTLPYDARSGHGARIRRVERGDRLLEPLREQERDGAEHDGENEPGRA